MVAPALGPDPDMIFRHAPVPMILFNDANSRQGRFEIYPTQHASITLFWSPYTLGPCPDVHWHYDCTLQGLRPLQRQRGGPLCVTLAELQGPISACLP